MTGIVESKMPHVALVDNMDLYWFILKEIQPKMNQPALVSYLLYMCYILLYSSIMGE